METPYRKSERNDVVKRSQWIHDKESQPEMMPEKASFQGIHQLTCKLDQNPPHKQLYLNFLRILFDKSVNKHKIVYKGILIGGKTNGRQTTDIDGC
jgi:hypothetical protein